MIIHGDCLEEMSKLESESVDLVVTSPPYNLNRNAMGGREILSKKALELWGEGYEGYNDFKPENEYAEWQYECLSEMMRVIAPTGAIFYNHRWFGKDLEIVMPTYVHNFPVRQIIIWYRGGGMTLVPHRYFPACYEVIYMIAKKDFKLRKGLGFTDVWRFPPEKNNPHPAPYPVALPERCLRASYGSIVLDPFLGSGTTAIAAKRCGWDYIGIEQSEEYVEMARKRISEEKPVLFN